MPKPPVITRVILPDLIKHVRRRPLMGKQQKATTLDAIKKTGYGNKAAEKILRGSQEIDKKKAKKIIDHMHKGGIQGLSLGGDRVVNKYVDVLKSGGPVSRAEAYMKKRMAIADKAMEDLKDRQPGDVGVDLTPRWEQVKKEREGRLSRPGLQKILQKNKDDKDKGNPSASSGSAEKKDKEDDQDLIQKWQAAKKIADTL